MPGMFERSIIGISENLNPEQRARAAALMVANETRSRRSVTELLRLTEYVVLGIDITHFDEPSPRRNPYELFADRPNQEGTVAYNPTAGIESFDPVHPTPVPFGWSDDAEDTPEDGEPL